MRMWSENDEELPLERCSPSPPPPHQYSYSKLTPRPLLVLPPRLAAPPQIVFPDPSWQRHVSLIDHLMAFGAVLGPYWYFPYSIMSKRTDASMQLIAFCVSMHTLGCVLMMASDTQKYFTLKIKKGLINNGWFGICRNTNYLGEMMIYGSYAALTQDWISWAILIYVWTLLFGRNMFNKEASIARKKGGKEYMDNSWMILPKPWGWMGSGSKGD